MTKILLIDDEQPLREEVAGWLRFEHYTVMEAGNGLDGVEIALSQNPDLIVCDIMMPGLDGYGVLLELQSSSTAPMIPFIFVTARGDRQSQRFGMELGADDYLTKPFTREELLHSVHVRLAKHASIMKASEKRPTTTTTQTFPVVAGEPNSLVGSVTHGYQFVEKIGEGSSGTVYKAYQTTIGREVAIKVLNEKYASSIEFIHRFQNEAELVARLEHPHIIPLYDYWYDDQGVYIVMRWLRGGSLRNGIARVGRYSLKETSHMLGQIADGLAVAHSIGIIHRDLKPDNILLDERDNAYVTDFGLAKNLIAGHVAVPEGDLENSWMETQADFFEQNPISTLYLTDSQQMIGTPAYLAPEQILLRPLSVQSDVYSLGITLYEMLTGVHPFRGNLGEVIRQHLHDPVASLQDMVSDLPAALDEVIQKATAKDPMQRYADVRALARDFRAARQQRV